MADIIVNALEKKHWLLFSAAAYHAAAGREAAMRQGFIDGAQRILCADRQSLTLKAGTDLRVCRLYFRPFSSEVISCAALPRLKIIWLKNSRKIPDLRTFRQFFKK